jgi:uncharacterized protein (DUF697 family)
MRIRDYLQRLFSRSRQDAELERRLEDLQKRAPVPVFWLFGKTQSGKTSIIKYLTGAEDAEIGAGFRPTTRFSRQYQFPSDAAPLLTFLDTRGLDEPGYDSGEDIARFNELAHVVVVTARVMDHAQERVLTHLQRIRDAKPQRPLVLALTCLHEAYPQQQHPLPYPFGTSAEVEVVPEDLRRSLAEQRQRFHGLADAVVPLDLTKPEEGYHEPNYGGDQLKTTLLEMLPVAYRQTLLSVEEATHALRDWHERRALPYILGYSTLAATAGAIPIPWVDLLILPGIQTRMIYHLARLYGQPLKGQRFAELASALGLGLIVRQAVREVAKVIPGVGSLVGSSLAASSTFALGKAFCYYYSAVLAGHVPKAEDLRRYYQEQLKQAEHLWHVIKAKAKSS